jgi:large subunit ribosomal protein L17
MHSHGNQGRKFGRERDQRKALIKGLATSIVINGQIETTLMKAKEVVPYLEDLVTKAKKADLHGRRQVLTGLSTVAAAHKLVDDIAPKLTARNSGHLRIKQTRLRVGDNAQLAKVSFVDDITATATPVAQEKPKKVATKAPVKAEK